MRNRAEKEAAAKTRKYPMKPKKALGKELKQLLEDNVEKKSAVLTAKDRKLNLISVVECNVNLQNI